MPALTLEAIQEAIALLNYEERLTLASWFHQQSMDEWDLQMQRDFAPGGRGAEFLQEVKREVVEGAADGTLRPIEEGFALRRNRRP